MLEKAKEKGVYKNCVTALIGSAPIEGIERGMCVCVCVCVQL